MKTVNPEKVYKLHMGPSKYALDLCDGSERGEYVSQDYILHTVGRKCRAINLMYCYYPNEPTWPQRACDAYADKNVSFAWDYPYEDYFPYGGGLNGDPDAEVFKQIRDIRSHGMDVILTLTMDPKLSDEQLRSIGHDLRKFGRVEVRINHECTGDWFPFTKRATYAELGEFFAHASEIIREEAPNVKTIICAGGIQKEGDVKVEKEDEFLPSILAADIWSIDKYLALHWGWPYDVAEEGGNSFARYDLKDVFRMAKSTYNRYKELNGGQGKPFVLAELNADGDVTGPYDQVTMMKEFVEMIKKDGGDWFTGFTFYQFRDRGRLGMEIEDPNNKYVGIKQPLMDYYVELINMPEFLPAIEERETLAANEEGDLTKVQTLRYGGATDCEGIAMDFTVPANPHFFELYFDDADLINLNCMIEVNGQWIRKAPGTKCVDLMEAFFKKPLTGETKVTVTLITPPGNGENALDAGDDLLNSYTTVKKLPKVRIETKPVA